MCTIEDVKDVRMAKLDTSTRQIIRDKFNGAKKIGQKVVRFPDSEDIWLLIPDDTPTRKTEKLIEFQARLYSPDNMYKTYIPQSFLRKAG